MDEPSITGSADDQQQNPYAASEPPSEALSSQSTQEILRHQYLAHEKSIQSLGAFYILGAAVAGLVAVIRIQQKPLGAPVEFRILDLGILAAAVLHGVVGAALWQLKPWARLTAAAMAGVGLLAVPCGTVFGPFVMYLLLCSKGRMVFSETYRDAITATPHVKYRTEVFTLVIVGILVLIVGSMLAAGLLR